MSYTFVDLKTKLTNVSGNTNWTFTAPPTSSTAPMMLLMGVG